MKNILFNLLLLSLLTACVSHPEPNLPEIKLSLEVPETDLKMEDISEHLQIVALETQDSVLIPSNFQVFANDQYIIITGDGCIYQFSVDGKYIGKLLTAGRGPGEYRRILSFRIDQELLYLLDAERHLFICDLLHCKLKQYQTLPITASKILCIQGDTLLYYVSPSPNNTIAYDFCRMTLDEQMIRCSHNSRSHKFLSDEGCNQLANGEIRFKPTGCDTLYAVNDFQKYPVALLECIDTKPDFKHYIYPLFENSSLYLIQVSPIHSETNAEGELKSITIMDAGYCLVDKKDYNVKKLSKIHIDTLGLDVDVKALHFSNTHSLISINALEFKEKLKDNYNKGILSPEIKQLYEKVQENDNPLFIIGKTKI